MLRVCSFRVVGLQRRCCRETGMLRVCSFRVEGLQRRCCRETGMLNFQDIYNLSRIQPA